MRKVLLQLLVVLFGISVNAQTVVYVSQDGSGNEDGSSWENAYPGANLQDAINNLESAELQNKVFVAQGIYYPTQTIYRNTHQDSTRNYSFTMKKGVAVYGGFKGEGGETVESRVKADEDGNGKVDPWEFTYKTVFSGEIQNDADSTNNSLHIVQFPYSDSLTTILDGVTVSDGYSNVIEEGVYWGSGHVIAAGICIKKGNVYNCYVTNCTGIVLSDGTTNTIGVIGTGITADTSVVVGCKVDNCVAYVNRSKGNVRGAGITALGSVVENSTIDNCHIYTVGGYEGPSTGGLGCYGGGMYAHRSYIDGCTITSCSSIMNRYGGYHYPNGGGAFIRSSRFTNNVIKNCYVETKHDISVGGGVYIGNHSGDNFEDAAMINCVVSNNTCVGRSRANGGGVYQPLYSTGWVAMPFINNTIVNNHLYASNGSTYYLYGSGIDCSKGYWHSQDPSPATLINNIVWGNVMGPSSKSNQVYTHSGSTLEYNAVEGATLTGAGNINLPASNEGETGPNFKFATGFAGYGTNSTQDSAALNANWGLTPSSVCLDAGILDTVGLNIPENAVYGNLRVYGDAIDLGAAEYAIYNIAYNLDGGINDDDNPETYAVDSPDFDLLDASKEYYLFDGWFTDPGFENQLATICKGSAGDLELWARWTPVEFSITYHLDGGTNDNSNPSSFNIESDEITLAEPTKDGAGFGGWYSDDTFQNEVTSIAQGSTGEMELWALWTYPDALSNNTTDNVFVYPNPCTGQIFVKSPESVFIHHLELRSLDGKVVSRVENERSLDLSDEIPGLYVLTIQTHEKILVRSIVVR